MPNRIKADSASGLQLISDSSDEIQIQSGSDTVATVNSSGITMGSGKNFVETNAPAFSAYLANAQTLSNNTWTKIVFNTEILDSNSAYDTSTGNFQPTVAGYYQINSAVRYSGNTTGVRHLSIYVNGTTEYRLLRQDTGTGSQSLSGSCLVYLNGSTDYVSAYGLQTSGGNLDLPVDVLYANIFQGFLARAV